MHCHDTGTMVKVPCNALCVQGETTINPLEKQQLVKRLDRNGDGIITLEEFERYLFPRLELAPVAALLRRAFDTLRRVNARPMDAFQRQEMAEAASARGGSGRPEGVISFRGLHTVLVKTLSIPLRDDQV